MNRGKKIYEGKAKILYCHDPDGAIIELIEEL